jgi:hypothetical protein
MVMDWLETARAWITGLGSEGWMSAGSALVAASSAIFSWRTMRRQELRETAGLKIAHDSDVIRWSDEVIHTLAECHELLCEKGSAVADSVFRERRVDLRARLSGLIDRGRLFFPNKRDGAKGADKEEGYQGHRQPALDALVEAYDLLRSAGQGAGPDLEAAEALLNHRRRFVAEVFKAVDPERRGMTLKQLQI